MVFTKQGTETIINLGYHKMWVSEQWRRTEREMKYST